MAASQARISLTIDVLGVKSQRAKVQSSLTPPELIEAILAEFTELAYLSDHVADYALQKVGESLPLKDNVQLAKQVKNQDHLALVEGTKPVPAGAVPANAHVYLCLDGTRDVFKLDFFPSMIGRQDAAQPNDLLAVDLTDYQFGTRVSRRHAQITMEQGRFYIESLSQNPTVLQTPNGAATQLDNRRTALQPGDTIVLPQSNTALTLLVRTDDRPTA